MKVSELMIGDWVLTLNSTHKEKVFAQVDAIEEGQHSILVTRECSNWFVDIDWIEPIPLIPEILEKNGFDKLEDESGKQRYRWEYADGIHISIDFTDTDPWVHVSNRCYFAVPYCEYVHQLQHALRLCGIPSEIII